MTEVAAPDVRPDPREDVRDYVYEMLGMVRLHAEVAQKFLEASDDVGTRYGLMRMVAHVRSATQTFNELLVAKKTADAED